MANKNSIESRIDILLNKDLLLTSVDEIIEIIIGNKGIEVPYEDLQSDAGFTREFNKIQNEINNLINGLYNTNPPILISEIEALSCKYEGLNLYNQILLASLKKDREHLYNELIGLNYDIGFIDKFIENKDPDFLRKINESLFDHIDPILVGKPSNSGSKKERELDVLGFKLPLVFIMNGKDIVHIKIGNKKTTIDDANKKIKEIIGLQNKNKKPCFGEVSDDINLGAYESKFYPDGEDPILNNDCLDILSKDDITGDIIQTKKNFESILDEFCDPPILDFIDTEISEDPNIEGIDLNEIQGCIDSAIGKARSIENDAKLLARWQNIERNLEEMLYHYEIIYEYQKNLAEIWRSRRPIMETGAPDNLDLGITILSYSDQVKELDRQIIVEKNEYNDSKVIFLNNNEIFTDNIFLLTIPDTELSDPLLTDLFNLKIGTDYSPVRYDENSKSWPIKEAIIKFKKNIDDIRYIIIKNNFISELINNRNEIFSLMNSGIDTLSKKISKPITVDKIEEIFKNIGGLEDPFSQGDSQQKKNENIFNKSENLGNGTYDAYGHQFLRELREFSVRFNNTVFNKKLGELQFNIAFINDFGNQLPYKKSQKINKISISDSTVSPFIIENDPDIEKIKLGNEYAGNGGLLNGYTTNYFNSSDEYFFEHHLERFFTINNIKSGNPDVANFYDFINKIASSNESKETIIERIINERGVLYGNLIEQSASTWLFFNQEERGDNDERDSSKIRPSSFDVDGEPIEKFNEFWGNFKDKWDEKYLFNKNNYVIPKFNKVKAEALKAATGLGNTLPLSDLIGIRIFENYFDIKQKYEEIQDTILIAAENIKKINDKLNPKNIENSFSDIKCTSQQTVNDPENCPPSCCGEAGSDFINTENYLLSSPPSSDCPSIFQKCWWKQFCRDITKVGLLPYPNGLPPIEDSSYFLKGGPSVRLGLKYWPVGYLPPSFIPIPVPNPIDGQFFIRIPLPMIWTIIPPIVITLPANLGIIVIFIPMIGGFMPSPLIYVKEFISGSSFFLTGTRGPRFIPRRSDPKITDPLEKFKQILSFGIPDKLISLPGFGLDDIDDKGRIIGDVLSNLNKIIDSIPPPSNVDELRDLQYKEYNIKEEKKRKRKKYEKECALKDSTPPSFDEEDKELDSLVLQRKDVISGIINSYINKEFPTPKSIIYPKDKDKLKVDTPEILKSNQSLNNMRSNLCDTKPPKTINIRSEIKDILRILKIETPSQYEDDNKGVSNSNQIFMRIDKDPAIMNNEELNDITKKIHAEVLNVTNILLKGNGNAINKKIRDGAFHGLKLSEYNGDFVFPKVQITNSAPLPLKLEKNASPLIEPMITRIIQGISESTYNREDFYGFVRYKKNVPELVIRVKDLKKIIAKKIGLSKNSGNIITPLDREEPIISNFPNTQNQLTSQEDISKAFGTAISSFELPTIFPPKQDQISQTSLAGGIIQTKIPGSIIKSFIAESISLQLKNGALEEIFPEINDKNSPKFINLQPSDIQKLLKRMIGNSIGNDKKTPPFLEKIILPSIPLSRPTDFIEQMLIGLGAPPQARMNYSLFWKYFKGVPKTPLSDQIIPLTESTSKILLKIPWPIAVLLGRDIINIINPMIMSDDHPSWRRMCLKNVYYAVYIDEFLRSAADVSGLFKFFLGASDLDYPIREFISDIKKEANIKKY